jgi:hypothetical protein
MAMQARSSILTAVVAMAIAVPAAQAATLDTGAGGATAPTITAGSWRGYVDPVSGVPASAGLTGTVQVPIAVTAVPAVKHGSTFDWNDAAVGAGAALALCAALLGSFRMTNLNRSSLRMSASSS